MSKRYAGLVTWLKLTGFLLMTFGMITGVLNAVSRYGSIASGALIFTGALVVGLVLNAVAAGVDLLAGMEVNSRTTAAYFERRQKS